jgi:hypothetical protein
MNARTIKRMKRYLRCSQAQPTPEIELRTLRHRYRIMLRSWCAAASIWPDRFAAMRIGM